nr:PREDICTED: TBC1 domain family member 12 isoform X1 [Lepisosteus oculatus]
MEKEENGASVLPLSVDVNENEQKTKPPGCRSGTASLAVKDNRNKVSSEDTKSVPPGRGSVHSAGDRNVSADEIGLPSQPLPAGGKKMLDFVTDCVPGRIKDSCVLAEQRSDGTLNGFIESSEPLMVGSGIGGGGGRGIPSRSSAAATKQGERNGMLIGSTSEGIRECGAKAEGCVAGKPDRGRFLRDPGSDLLFSPSCDGRQQQNCTCTASPATDMKLTNGDVDCIPRAGDTYSECCERPTLSRPAAPCKGGGAAEREAKLANGGVLMVNESESLDASADFHGRPDESPGDTEPPAPLGRCGQGSSDGVAPGDALETQAGGPSVCPASERGAASPEPSTSPAEPGEHPTKAEEISESSSLRPLTLRTNKNTTACLSCDATPVSPDGGQVCSGSEEEHDPRFMDVAVGSRNTFEVSRRQSAPDNLPDGLSLPADSSAEQGSKPKKLGISDFFSRSLFSRKGKEPKTPSQSVPGWKLFGKVPLRENTQKDSKTIQQDSNPGNLTSVSTPNLLSTGEYEARTGKASNPPPQPGRRKNLEFEPLSTTALILEDRPANLPAKSAVEAQRHRQEYDEMVAEAKKREMKEAQKKKKIMKERYKQEEIIANAMVIWNTEILPNWETMRNTRKVRELWWQGLPPSVRGKVWSLAIGNELNITHELYEIFLSRAKERWKSFSETGSENEAEDSGVSLADRESSLELIKLDISRTFPSLFIFQKGGPYHDLLHSVLGAYTCYRPDVGYVQGMSFIAAVLILNLEEADAFIAFANLLNKPCQMAFFRVDHDLMLKYFAAFEVFFDENLPRLFAHFQSYNLTPDLYLIDWIFTLYSKSLPLDLACRVWDVFCRDGEEFLFRTGLGILKLYEDILLQMDFIHIAQFLTRLPEETTSEKLFSCIAAVQMLSSNKKWIQVFTALMKDSKELDKNNSPAQKS